MTVKIDLTKDDLGRINSCDNYLSTKRFMQSAVDYREFEIGTAVHIKYKDYNGDFQYQKDGRDKPPHKWLIIHNDEGFIFAKRILASGKPGLIVECLTIKYPSSGYSLELDSEYADSVLFDTEYDPTAQARELSKKKNKASAINKKKRLLFDNALESYEYIKKLAIGDVLYMSYNSYGENIDKFVVSEIINFVPKQNSASRSYYHQRRGLVYHDIHEAHVLENFSGIKIMMKCVESESLYSRYDKELSFNTITNSMNYSSTIDVWYKEKPVKATNL